MGFDDDSVSSAVQNMIDRYGEDALAEVDLRIEELRSSPHKDALELWIKIRTHMRSQMAGQSGSQKH